jgi:Cu-processing system ATP-binding protein
VIRFQAFTKRFGRRTAVDGLTLDVPRGEAVALLGPNGSGKTTTLKAAAGLITPTAGRVLLGDDGAPAALPEARRTCSFLPQKSAFPDTLTGREVLEFFRRLRDVAPVRTTEALRFASLNGAGDRAVGTYSGGMLQRLGLAVAILPDTPVLLLDEPTAALDPDGLCAFYGLVDRRRAEGKTVFFTSHQLGDVERLADRIAILVEGRLIALFTQVELADRLASRGVMRLRFSRCAESVLSAVRRLSPRATWSGGELVVPGPAALRPAVLDAVRAEGCEIRDLTAEDERLDGLYRELVGAARS